MGSFGLGTSESRTSERKQENTGPLTVTGGTAAQILQTGKSVKNVAQGAISLEQGSNIGGQTLGRGARIGRGANVTFTTTNTGIDPAGLDNIADRLAAAVASQADNTAAALGSIGNISDTRQAEDGGFNFSTPVLAIMAAGVGSVALVALAIVFKK